MRQKGQSIGHLIKAISYLKKYKAKYIIYSLLCTSASTGITLLTAFAMKDMVDAAINQNMEMLIRGVIFILLGTILLSSILYIFDYRLTKITTLVLNDVRLNLFKKVEDLPVSFYEKNHTGDLISRINNDVQMLESIYTQSIGTILYIVFNGVGAIVTMFFLDKRIASILVAFGIMSCILSFLLAKPLRKYSDRILKLYGETIEKIQDMLSGLFVVKLFNLKDIILNKILDTNERAYHVKIKRVKLYAMYEGANFFTKWLSYGGVMAFGSYLVFDKQLTFGSLIGITQLVQSTNGMFMYLSMFLGPIISALAGAARIFETMDEKAEPLRYPVEGVQGSNAMVEFKDVRFAYESGKDVIRNISFAAEKGKVVAFVGGSGGGKSTVIKLLLGFYPPNSGQITVNGKGFGEYTLDELREHITYVPQDAYLYEGTIEENILYGRMDATKEQVIEAAKVANAHDFILEQPQGYDTLVGERGIKLSGGQKQRIAIARALLKNASILLLDEATSALDSESEHLVQEALNRLMKGRTVIAIAHRLSTIQHADVIYVIENGDVEEQGTHYELLERDGVYKRLFELQFKSGENVSSYT